MQNSKALTSFQVIVSIKVGQVVQNFDISLESCIMKTAQAVFIFFIDPFFN